MSAERPGQVWGRLTRSMVTHTLALEASKSDPLSTRHLRAKEGLATDRDEFKTTFLKGDEYDELRESAFTDIVAGRVETAQEREREDREDAEFVVQFGKVLAERRAAINDDWPIIRREFPGQYGSDAGFPAPEGRRRGW